MLKSISHMVLFFIFLLVSVAEASKVSDIQEVPEFFSYNSLPDVRLASQKLNEEENLSQFMSQALNLLEDLDLADKVGFRLIHRHDTINEDEDMVEAFFQDDEDFVYISEPKNKKENFSYVPASWIVSDHGFNFFEYTEDQSVRKFNTSTDLEKINLIRDLILDYKLEKYLAIAVLARESFSDIEVSPSYRLIETTEFGTSGGSANVVKFRDPGDFQDGNIYQTSWWFYNPFSLKCVNSGCHSYCLSIHGSYPQHAPTHTSNHDWYPGN